MPAPRNVEVLRDAPPEQKKGILSHLNRHKGKYLLGLAALAAGGVYGLGKAGLGGHLATGANNVFVRNSPQWLTNTARQVSSVAGTRFVNLVDHNILRRPAIGATGFPAEHVRKNIAEGRGPGED